MKDKIKNFCVKMLKLLKKEVIVYFFMMISVCLSIYLQLKGVGYAHVALAVFCIALYIGVYWKDVKGFNYIDAASGVISLYLLYKVLKWNTVKIENIKDFLRPDGTKLIVFNNVLILTLIVMISMVLRNLVVEIYAKVKKIEAEKSFSNVKMLIVVCMMLILVYVFARMISIKGLGYTMSTNLLEGSYFSEPIHLLNIIVTLLMCLMLYSLFGLGIGGLLSAILLIFIFASNYVKIIYHATFFTWFDLMQIKELYLMGKEFITVKSVLIVIFSVAAIVAICVVFRKHLKKVFKPHFSLFKSISTGITLMMLISMILNDRFKAMDIYTRGWENETVNVRYNGLVVNMILNFKVLDGAIMDEPDNYSEKTALELKKEFDDLDIEYGENVKPDVILILDESLFDLDAVPGFEFSEPIDEVIEPYKNATLISPRYGGYTSAMEWESLTGFSLAYLPNSLTPYTTYYNNPNEVCPSIAQEFLKNGYITKAMHPDLPAFYNRTTVYKCFGFEQYLALSAFDKTEENTTNNGWVKDYYLAEKIIDELEKDDEPQFIFAITMEGHYVTVDKYDDPSITVSGDGLTDADINQIQQQAQSYYDASYALKDIIDYMDSTDRPTLLYVYGDHLPPMDALGKVGYTKDKYNKYSTTFISYSNYCDIDIGAEYITTNQIAAQIMVDSGVEHSSYYDYIYSIKDEYPVLHKEFVDVENNEDLDDYYYMQYDLMFGKRYLVE